MSRKSVIANELNSETALTDSPLRRSSRIASSPAPKTIATRRGSAASDISVASSKASSIGKTRRSSASSIQDVSENEAPNKRITKKTITTPKETEDEGTKPIRKARAGSVSKVLDLDVEQKGPSTPTRKTRGRAVSTSPSAEPPKTRTTRRSSIIIEEAPEPKKTTRTRRGSVDSVKSEVEEAPKVTTRGRRSSITNEADEAPKTPRRRRPSVETEEEPQAAKPAARRGRKPSVETNLEPIIEDQKPARRSTRNRSVSESKSPSKPNEDANLSVIKETSFNESELNISRAKSPLVMSATEVLRRSPRISVSPAPKPEKNSPKYADSTTVSPDKTEASTTVEKSEVEPKLAEYPQPNDEKLAKKSPMIAEECPSEVKKDIEPSATPKKAVESKEEEKKRRSGRMSLKKSDDSPKTTLNESLSKENKNISIGSDGSFVFHLDVSLNSQEDEADHKTKTLISPLEVSVKESKKSVDSPAVMKGWPHHTRRSSFFEPMEVNYATDVENSVMQTPDEEEFNLPLSPDGKTDRIPEPSKSPRKLFSEEATETLEEEEDNVHDLTLSEEEVFLKSDDDEPKKSKKSSPRKSLTKTTEVKKSPEPENVDSQTEETLEPQETEVIPPSQELSPIRKSTRLSVKKTPGKDSPSESIERKSINPEEKQLESPTRKSGRHSISKTLSEEKTNAIEDSSIDSLEPDELEEVDFVLNPSEKSLNKSSGKILKETEKSDKEILEDTRVEAVSEEINTSPIKITRQSPRKSLKKQEPDQIVEETPVEQSEEIIESENKEVSPRKSLGKLDSSTTSRKSLNAAEKSSSKIIVEETQDDLEERTKLEENKTSPLITSRKSLINEKLTRKSLGQTEEKSTSTRKSLGEEKSKRKSLVAEDNLTSLSTENKSRKSLNTEETCFRIEEKSRKSFVEEKSKSSEKSFLEDDFGLSTENNDNSGFFVREKSPRKSLNQKEETLAETNIEEKQSSRKSVSKTLPEAKSDRKSLSKTEEIRKSLSKNDENRKSLSKIEEPRKSLGKPEDTRKSLSKIEESRKSLGKTEQSRKSLSKTQETRKSLIKAEETRLSLGITEKSRKSLPKAEETTKSPAKTVECRKSLSKIVLDQSDESDEDDVFEIEAEPTSARTSFRKSLDSKGTTVNSEKNRSITETTIEPETLEIEEDEEVEVIQETKKKPQKPKPVEKSYEEIMEMVKNKVMSIPKIDSPAPKPRKSLKKSDEDKTKGKKGRRILSEREINEPNMSVVQTPKVKKPEKKQQLSSDDEASDEEVFKPTETTEKYSKINEKVMSKLDKLLSDTINETSSEDEDYHEGQNSFFDDEAMEGDEDTPSEDSNQIIDEGESIHSTESEFDSDESYDEDDSFIDDDVDVELLSGEENFDLSFDTKKSAKKLRSRIISNDQFNDTDEIIVVAKKSVKETKKSPRKRIVEMVDSSDEDVPENDIKASENDVDALENDVNASDNDVEVVASENDDEDSSAAENESAPPGESPVQKTPASLNQSVQSSTPNTSFVDLLNTSKKSPNHNSSSVIVHENINVKDIKDGALSEKIHQVVEFFCSGIKTQGNVSLNVSLDYMEKKNETGNSKKRLSSEMVGNVDGSPSKKEKIETPKTENEKRRLDDKSVKSAGKRRSSLGIAEKTQDTNQTMKEKRRSFSETIITPAKSPENSRASSFSDDFNDTPEPSKNKKRLSVSLIDLSKSTEESSPEPKPAKPSRKQLKKLKRQHSNTDDDLEIKPKKSKLKLKKLKSDLKSQCHNLLHDVLTDVKNRSRRSIRPTTSCEQDAWETENVALKPNKLNLTRQEKDAPAILPQRSEFDAKDFKNQMIYNSARNKRVDTKHVLKKKGVFL